VAFSFSWMLNKLKILDIILNQNMNKIFIAHIQPITNIKKSKNNKSKTPPPSKILLSLIAKNQLATYNNPAGT